MSNDQLPAHFKQSDFENLEEFLKEERQLNFLRKNLLDKIQKCSEKIDKEWEQMDTKVRCVLIGDMQKYLFQLQLMEHVSRKPLLDIAIGLFLHNPERCVQRKLSPVKSKPPKRRKNNEFCGFTSNNSIEEIGVKRVPSSNQDKLDFDDQGSFGDHLGPNIEARLRRHVRTIKNTPHHSPSRVGDKEEDEDDIGDEEDSASLNLILKSPSPTLEEDCSMVLSRRRMDSVNTEQIGNSSPAIATRNIQKFGRKEGEIVSVEVANGLAGVRSPRKRGIEAQRNNNESNVTTDAKDDGFQEEKDDGFHKQTFDEPTYCLCEQVSFGDMICCDFELCSVEWFHFSCVNIKSKPKGKKWYCPLCRYNDKTNLLKPELQQKLDQTKKSAQGQ